MIDSTRSPVNTESPTLRDLCHDLVTAHDRKERRLRVSTLLVEHGVDQVKAAGLAAAIDAVYDEDPGTLRRVLARMQTFDTDRLPRVPMPQSLSVETRTELGMTLEPDPRD